MPSASRVLLSLPNETLTTVFEYLGPETLVNLVLVCHRLQGVGERLLYDTIVISEIIDTESAPIVTPYKTVGCCMTIQRRPYLASAITKLHIRWNRDRNRLLDCKLAPGVAQYLRHLLQVSTHIESLELHLAGLCGPFEEILGGCSFKLRYLSLSGSVNEPIEWFLQTQPAIVHLHLGDQHRPLKLSRADLPLLETFRGDPRTAASVLPMRPVHWLALSGQELSEECLQAFPSSSNAIRWLDLGSLSITPTQLLAISKHFRAVECLRMKLALRHTLHFTFSGMMLLAPLTQVLCAFHSLAWLDLSPTSVDGVRGVRTETDEYSLCATWANVCPSLRRVKFPSGTDWTVSSEGVWISCQPAPVSRR